MKYVHNAATIAGAIVAEILNHPSEGFALQAPQYGGTTARRAHSRSFRRSGNSTVRAERLVPRADADDRGRSLLGAADAALRSRSPRDAHGLYEQVLAEATDAEVRADALAGLGFVAH